MSVDMRALARSGAGPPRDALSPRFVSDRWILRRVDRLEFRDLTTVHRRITFTLDLGELIDSLSDGARAFPLGLFRRDTARAGTRLEDAAGNAIPHLTLPAGDALMRAAVEERVEQLLGPAVPGDLVQVLDHIQAHSPSSCRLLLDGVGGGVEPGTFDGYASLAAEKWGCPAVGRLLARLLRAPVRDEAAALRLSMLVRLLFDWQNNFVLFVPIDPQFDTAAPRLDAALTTLVYSFDEELRWWRTPWDRRRKALGRDDQRRLARATRRHIGRPPFRADLDGLRPGGLRGFLCTVRFIGVRRLARRSFTAWHVAWQQSSSRDVAYHVVEVALPADLAVVRLRMVERYLIPASATGAGGVRARERVVAAPLNKSPTATLPVPPRSRSGPSAAAGGRLPQLSDMFLSLVVSQPREDAPWLAAIALAAATGIVILIGALRAMTEIVAQAGAAVTVLLLAPTLVSALLSAKAANDIAQELTLTLRVMVASIGVLAIASGVGLIVQPNPTGVVVQQHTLPPDLRALKWTWVAIGVGCFAIAGVLWWGWRRLGRLLGYRDLGPGQAPGSIVPEGDALRPGDRSAPSIPPPDRWIETGEGDRIPWGWLWVPADAPADERPLLDGAAERCEDRRYWSAVASGYDQRARLALLAWRRGLFDTSAGDGP
jgi:hypothetical protein